jgi:hypothetical protein
VILRFDYVTEDLLLLYSAVFLVMSHVKAVLRWVLEVRLVFQVKAREILMASKLRLGLIRRGIVYSGLPTRPK